MKERNEKLEEAAVNLLAELKLDLTDEEIKETPRRIADLYTDMTEGLHINIDDYFARQLPSKHNELVIIKGIEFVSMCEHHFWPFFGKAHVAYIPKKRIVGLSKFHSAVRALARRPQLQERMTSDLAETIDRCLEPQGVMIVIEGIHTCMLVGGRFDYGMPAHTSAKTITSAVRGVFLLFKAPRDEALKLIYGGE